MLICRYREAGLVVCICPDQYPESYAAILPDVEKPRLSGLFRVSTCKDSGANMGTRTPDLLITNQLLYQLSYVGSVDMQL